MQRPNAFHVVVSSVHRDSLREAVASCVYGLESLGYEVTQGCDEFRSNAVNILLAAGADAALLERSRSVEHLIVYNWEQILPSVPWVNWFYFQMLAENYVWDYSRSNIETLHAAGIDNAHYLPMTYAPSMTQVVSADVQDIDVLFYGNLHERRQKVIDSIRALGLNVVTSADVGGMQGEVRDAYLARSRIVLNLHGQDESRAFEVARVSYLFANSKAVVSELNPHSDIDDDFRAVIAHGALADLPQLCYELVQNVTKRHALEQAGFQAFVRRDVVAVMKQAVGAYFDRQASSEIKKLPQTLQINQVCDAYSRWRFDFCNIDARPDFGSDLTLNISQPLPFDQLLHSWRFGNVTLQRNSFQKIIAHNIFQRVDDLKIALSNCMELLAVGGNMELIVPLDLSYDAWMHIDDKRAFNDKTWESIINNWWQHDWGDYRFEIHNISYGLHNEYGHQVLANNGGDWGVAMKTPRAIDTISVTLHKRPITDDERKQLPQTRFMD